MHNDILLKRITLLLPKKLIKKYKQQKHRPTNYAVLIILLCITVKQENETCDRNYYHMYILRLTLECFLFLVSCYYVCMYTLKNSEYTVKFSCICYINRY